MIAPAPLPPLNDAELRELRLLHGSLPYMRHLDFDYVLRCPELLGCLRNTLEARNERARRLKKLTELEAANFTLTPS